jgi:ankyrin repeat protein
LLSVLRTVAGEILVPPGATPLDRAAAASDFAVVETLLAHEKGANVHGVYKDSTNNALFFAKTRGAARFGDGTEQTFRLIAGTALAACSARLLGRY